MIIAVASGKGGTGKTTVTTNLAYLAARDGADVAYLDCDVEAPNGALFLEPQIRETHPVRVSVPKIDAGRCTGCGLCGQICQYSAIVAVQDKMLVFPELCHGCGGCWRVCPVGAVTEAHRTIGRIELGTARGAQFVQGLLDIGQAMSPAIIRAVKAAAPDAELTLIDSPPGTSCPVIESTRDADFVLLVTEPTPFGLNDLKLAVDMARAMERPFGVLINRAEDSPGETHAWCLHEHIPILAEIPDDRRVAEAYSRGKLMCEVYSGYAGLYLDLLAEIRSAVRKARPETNGRAGQ
jgi:MinD superfamily P-loop ATPase